MAGFKGIQAVLIAAILSIILCCSTAWAQSDSCQSALISLASCLNFLQGNSTTPSNDCCSGFNSLVKSSPDCICSVVNGGGASQAAAFGIKQTQALQLPTKCKSTFTLSQCGSNNASSPSNAPSSPSSTPGNDGSTSKASLTLLISMLLIAVFPSVIF